MSSNWPLGCTSLPRLIVHAIATLVFILFGVTLVYWTICRELPELHANAWRTNVEVRLSEMLQSAEVCRVSVFQWEGRALVQELCMPVAIDAALLLLNVWLVFQSHRRWVRYALVLMAALFYVDMPAKLYQATFPAPDVVQIDPSYALVDEEILVPCWLLIELFVVTWADKLHIVASVCVLMSTLDRTGGQKPETRGLTGLGGVLGLREHGVGRQLRETVPRHVRHGRRVRDLHVHRPLHPVLPRPAEPAEGAGV